MLDAKPASAYALLEHQVRQAYEDFGHSFFSTGAARLFDSASLYNLAWATHPVSQMKSKLDGAPAIVIGGGPSLDELLPWVRAHQEHFVIFAAARSSRRLMKEGVRVDFYLSVDPHDVSFDNSKHMLLAAKESILLNYYHMNPKLLSQWSGINLYAGRRHPWDQDSGNTGAMGNTVIHFGIGLAEYFGCANIYLVGVDMCYRGLKTHEGESSEAEFGKYGVDGRQTVQTYRNEMTDTSKNFQKGVVILEGMIAQFKKNQSRVNVFNLSLDAAVVSGVPYRDVQHVVESEDKLDMFSTITDIYHFEPGAYTKQINRNIRDIQTYRKQFSSALSLCQSAVKMLNKDTILSAEEQEKLAKQVKKVELLIGENQLSVYEFGIGFFSALTKPVDQIDLTPVESQFYEFKRFFMGYSQSLQALVETIDEAVKRAKWRLAEINGPLTKGLLQEWEKNQEFGRAEVWKRWHSEEVAYLDELERIERLFKRAIESDSSSLIDSQKARSQSIKVLLNELDEILQQGKYADLPDIINLFKTALDETFHEEVDSLFSGIELERNGEFESAFSKYIQVIHQSEMKFFSLRKALKLLLNQKPPERVSNQTMLIFEELCQISEDYLVSYADYWALHGNLENAINLLAAYIKKKPQDVSALFRVVELATKQENFTLVKEACHRILALEPNNEAALTALERVFKAENKITSPNDSCEQAC